MFGTSIRLQTLLLVLLPMEQALVSHLNGRVITSMWTSAQPTTIDKFELLEG